MSTASGIFQAITNANSIVITAHRSPDGDSIGSSMALYHLLRKWQKNVTVVHPDPAPEFLHWVPSQEVIIDFENQAEKASELLLAADLIFCLDYNEPSRVGKDMQEVLVQSKAVKVMIDHHLHPADFCDFTLSETSACSTCELLFQWLKAIQKENEIDAVIGQCLYLGIMTDTGSFRFPSVSSGTHEIVAFLIEKGVKHFEIHEAVFDTNTIDRIRLKGYALSEKLVLIPGIPVAYASLSEEELNRFNYQKGDTEGLVNQILGIQGIKMAVFFAEKDGKVKISFRSKGEYVVNQLANDHFEGGGHAYASGGISFVSLDETIAKFVTNVKNYIPVA
jgi:phosphoesterase RecJ-like protein